MTADFLDWLDGQDDPADRDESGWACDTIDKAEGAARRLRRATDEIAAIDAVKTRMIADANAWRDIAAARHESIVTAERANLETFLRQQIKDGGAKSAPLPWGVTVKARKTGGTLVFPAGFEDSAPEDVLRWKPATKAIDSAKAKAYYTIAENGVVVDPNGEIIEAITVVPVEDKFEVVS